MSESARYGAIEAGGTKVICGWANEEGEVLQSCHIPTRSPEEVVSDMSQFFLSVSESGKTHPTGVGIGTFGPVDLDPNSDRYGAILKTPKSGWEGANLIPPIKTLFPDAKVVVETDVNAAALGEIRWGAATALDNVVYFTVGTGIGCGVIANGKPIHGMVHPEIGHMRIPRNESDRNAFAGICPFHGDCLEGLASGPAIEARWGTPANALPSNHQAWNTVASDLAWACVNMIVTVSPQRIVIGGGVSQVKCLFPKIREKVLERLNGYVDRPEIIEHIDTFIVPPRLGQEAGLKGALSLVL